MPKKPFAWSISRLGAFTTCGRRHEQVDLLKNFSEGPNAQRDYGGEVHKALELACRDGVPLPFALQGFQPVVNKVLAIPGDKFYEQKLALTRDFQPCGYFDKDCWLRVVIDVLALHEGRGAALDYKTGKIKADMDQLLLNAAVIFAYHPEVDTIDAAYWWICQKGKLTHALYKRADLPEIWNRFLPRVKAYEVAYTNDKFFPNPSGLCKNYCPVTTCPYHGK